MMAAKKQPMQPVVLDENGRHRFHQNEIVRYLIDNGNIDLNMVAGIRHFSAEDRMQFAQLLGYSISGYGELSYVTDESYDAALAAADALEKEEKN